MARKRVLWDVGHERKDDRGSTQYDGESEITFTLPVSLMVKASLEAKYDVEVVMLHDGDGLSNGTLADELKARGDKANALGGDLLVSLHHNAGPKEARGAELYLWTDKRGEDGELLWLNAVGNHKAPKSYALAVKMLPAIRDTLAEIGIPWRGAKDRLLCADFAMLRYPKMPCVLLETHYGSNHIEDELMDNPVNRQKLADGIAKGIAVALNLPAKPEPKPANAVTVLLHGVEIECNALLEGNKSRADIRPFAEALGYTVEKWDEKSKTVHLGNKKG